MAANKNVGRAREKDLRGTTSEKTKRNFLKPMSFFKKKAKIIVKSYLVPRVSLLER